MATANKSAVSVARTVHGGPPLVESYPEAASQTFKKGEAVYLDGSGNIAEFTAAIDDATQDFIGYAAEDGHNDAAVDTTRKTMVYVRAGNVFEANVTAAGSDQITAKTQVGTVYPMYQDTTNSIIMVDISDTSGQADACRIVRISPKGTVGDTNGRVEFEVVTGTVQVHAE